MKIIMFKMGFGESILLEHDRNCLLTDCGSYSFKKSNYFNNVALQLRCFSQKDLLITHFHEDHINGLKELENNGIRFDKVYLPDIFKTKHPNVIDMHLIEHILSGIIVKDKTKWCLWDVIKNLMHGRNNIHFLKRGDTFQACGEQFEVLWPNPDELNISRSFSHIKKELLNTLELDVEFFFNIYRITDKISLLLNQYTRIDSEGILDRIYRDVENIDEDIATFLEKIDKYFQNDTQKEILKELRDKIKNISNKSSIVYQSNFHNRPIFMCGDATKRVLEKIEKNSVVPSIQMYKEFYMLKAPHHGTKTHYYHFNNSNYWVVAISNGENKFHKNTSISDMYVKNQAQKKYVLKCTNSSIFCCDNTNYIKCHVFNICGVFYPMSQYIII